MSQATLRTIDTRCLNVAVCHRDPLLSLGVVAALSGSGRFRVRTQASTASSFAINEARCADALVCDYETGLAFLKTTGDGQELPRVLIVTTRETEFEIQDALSSGVLGYVLVGCQLEEIVDGVQSVSSGLRYVAAAPAQRLAERLSYQALTNREAQVMSYVAVGMSNKMVANKLGLTEGTVKSHVKAILEKLNVRTRTEAANVATRRGIIPLVSPDLAPPSKAGHHGKTSQQVRMESRHASGW